MMVRPAGLEPARLAAPDFKSVAATSYATGAGQRLCYASTVRATAARGVAAGLTAAIEDLEQMIHRARPVH